MTERQPTLKEAERSIRRIEQVLKQPFDFYWGCGRDWPFTSEFYGLNYKPRRSRWWLFIPVPYSDISLKCADCNRIILDRRDQIAGHVTACDCPDYWKRGHWRKCAAFDGSRFCISCGSRRLAEKRKIDEYHQNHKLIKMVKGKINECR